MAKQATNNNPMRLPDGIGRMNPRPLDADSYFTSLAAARQYATTGKTSYVGQILTVVEGGVARQYKIADTAGNLHVIYDEGNPPVAGGGAGSMVTLAAAQVDALIAANGSYTFAGVEHVTVLALYVNGLMQDSSLFSVSGNRLSVSLTSGDEEIVSGDSVSILYTAQQ